MAAKITSLTAAQESKLAEYRERWLQFGLSTQPTDRKGAEAAVADAYRAAKLPPPRIVIWLASPMAGAAGAAMLAKLSSVSGDQVWAQVRDQVWAQVRDQVGDQVGDQVWDQVRAQVGDQVWAQVQVRAQVRDQVWAQVRDQVGDQVGDQVWAQVGDQVRAQVRAQVRDQVRAQVGDQVWVQVRAQVGDQVWDQVWDQVGRAGYGSHDANWLGFYEFFWRECGCDYVAPLKGLIDHAQCGGWWWPFAGAVILTERPTLLQRDARNRLHCESGPALRYSDGWGVYAWHGMRVPADVIEHPESIDLARIEGEKNAEMQRVLIERYGLSRYVRDAGFEVLDADVDGEGMPRRLLRRRDVLVVELTNSTADADESNLDLSIDDYIAKKMVANPMAGTRRIYHVPCHPELRPMHADGTLGEPQKMTALNAVASTYGYRGEEYAPAVET